MGHLHLPAMNANYHTINPGLEDLIMLKKSENLPEELVSCKVCLKEIPRSVASSQEGSDYVLYFCGENCFMKWREGKTEAGGPDMQTGQ